MKSFNNLRSEYIIYIYYRHPGTSKVILLALTCATTESVLIRLMANAAIEPTTTLSSTVHKAILFKKGLFQSKEFRTIARPGMPDAAGSECSHQARPGQGPAARPWPLRDLRRRVSGSLNMLNDAKRM